MMSTERDPLTRRALFERGLSLTVLAAVVSACSSSSEQAFETVVPRTVSQATTGPDTLGVLEPDISFAEPWREFTSSSMTGFGAAALLVAPTALDHARINLAGLTSHSSSEQRAQQLATANDGDATNGYVVEVDGWFISLSMAGLAIALMMIAQ